ncbi:MAG TPA: serine--tRNA ligase [Planctomycetota bacterium]|nr:serine--tRNA ligase [Planctomycetota bacterium]
MLSLDFIRENPEAVRRAVADKHDAADVDRILALDSSRRSKLTEVEALKAERNAGSKEVGRLMKEKRDEAEKLKSRMKELGDKVAAIEKELAATQEELDGLLLRVPNVPDDSVPAGAGAEGNVEVRSWGQKPEFSFQPKAHWDIGEALGILDFPRATKISGHGFTVFKGLGARLERALIAYMLDLAAKAGYTEVAVPYLVNRASMTGTGQLPKLEEDMYKLAADELYLIPTAEVPVTNLHAGETLQAEALPLKYCCYSACFRREAGSYGKDTRGMIRVHQFDKVELVKIVREEDSPAEHEALTADAERVLQSLGLHYRTMLLCRGDLSFAAARCYDIEVWAPGQGRFLEVSSCSNFRDFQARRMGLKYKDGQSKPRFCHTLNGSGTALPRLVVALLETYQQADGSVLLPEPLRPYLGGLERIKS